MREQQTKTVSQPVCQTEPVKARAKKSPSEAIGGS